jgi:hypothetical protein
MERQIQAVIAGENFETSACFSNVYSTVLPVRLLFIYYFRKGNKSHPKPLSEYKYDILQHRLMENIVHVFLFQRGEIFLEPGPGTGF